MAKPIISHTTGAVAALLLTALVASGCHHRPHHVPDWNQVPPPPVHTLPPAQPAPPEATYPTAPPPPPVVISGPAEVQAQPVRTFTAGCSGGYSLVDASGRVVRTGRAYNTGNGLVTLDAQGRQGAPVSQAGPGQSLLFLPDCACGAGTASTAPPAGPHGHGHHAGCPPHRH